MFGLFVDETLPFLVGSFPILLRSGNLFLANVQIKNDPKNITIIIILCTVVVS